MNIMTVIRLRTRFRVLYIALKEDIRWKPTKSTNVVANKRTKILLRIVPMRCICL